MIANHFKVSLESKPTIENLVYTVSLRFGCYAPDLIEPITATLYPHESLYATEVHTLRRIIFQRKRSGAKMA